MMHDVIATTPAPVMPPSGGDFRLAVSEGYYTKDGLIRKIIAYYPIGEIREDRAPR